MINVYHEDAQPQSFFGSPPNHSFVEFAHLNFEKEKYKKRKDFYYHCNIMSYFHIFRSA